MEKTRINVDILLPELPNERDECVSRIIKSLENKRGIEKVHVVPEKGYKKAQLCFHYDPSVISINKVEQLAKQAGADNALMADKLENLPFAIGLSKKAHGIIKQNLVISLGMVVILIPLTILGIAHIDPGVIGHEGSTLVVVVNALRLLAYTK